MNGVALVDIGTLLSRADEHTLQDVLGRAAVRLMMLLDSRLATPSHLRELLLRTWKPEDLLLSRPIRDILVEVLKHDDASLLAKVVKAGGPADPYAALKGLRLARGSERERLFFNFFELDPPPVELVDMPATRQSITTGYSLFAHQRRAAAEARALLQSEPHRVLLHMPTGSGKTRTTMDMISDHLRSTEPTVVVWLAHSEELCEQAVGEFQRAWSQLGNRAIDVQRFWGNHRSHPDELTDGLVVAGLAKLFSAAKADLQVLNQLGLRATLIVMDEAHQAVADTYRLVLDALFVLGRRTGLLGLTATPGRTWSDIQADEELSDFFCRRKVSLEVEGYDNPVDYLVDEGYLARTDFAPLFYSGTYEPSMEDLKRIEADLDIPVRVLEKLAEDDQRNLAIVRSTEAVLSRHKRVILFAASVAHAYTLTSALVARGHRADCVTGETPSATRQQVIARFKDTSDDACVICNYGVLTTGFDAPRTSAVVIARPTKSLVLYSQMVGRAIRGPKAGGNETAEVVTVVDRHLPGFGGVVDAFTNWEDVWATQ